MKSSFARGAACALALASVFVTTALGVTSVQGQRRGRAGGAKPAAFSRKRADDAARRSLGAAQAFRKIMSVPERGIPRELLEDAEAVAVFPDVFKAAFIVGGRKGQGVVSRRTKTGWSAPAFLNLGGGSVGFQVGAAETDYVLLFMNEEALRGLLEDKFEIGGEASIAAGPVGRAIAASTNPTLDAGILSYSRSKGAFVGVALKGVVISPDNDLNTAFYGKEAKEVIAQGLSASGIPSNARAFPLMLSRYSVRRKP